MTRRKSSKEHVSNGTLEHRTESIITKKRGRPKKVAEVVSEKLKKEKVAQEVEKVASSATRQGGEKIVLKHFTEEEILAEGKRRRVMWASVSLVVIVVFFVWAANLKRIVGVDAADGGSLISFNEFKKGFSQNFKQINSNIAELKKEVASSSEEMKQATTSESENSSTYDTNIEEINKELKEMIINASTTINNK